MFSTVNLWRAVNFVVGGLLSSSLSEIPFLSLYPLSLGMSLLCAEKCPRLFSLPSPMSFPPGIRESQTGPISSVIELSVKRRNFSRGRCYPALNQDQLGTRHAYCWTIWKRPRPTRLSCVHSCYLLRPNESQNAFNGDNKWNFLKVILSPLIAISCQKSYTQTGNMLLLQWSLFVILWNAGIWKRKFSSAVESLFCGGGSFLLDWGFWFSPTSKQKRSLLFCLKTWWHSSPWEIIWK